jgi:hypothetical protein
MSESPVETLADAAALGRDRADAEILMRTVGLLHECQSDLELDLLYARAKHAFVTALPLNYLGCVVFDYAERWLEITDDEHEARAQVERLYEQLAPLVETESVDVDVALGPKGPLDTESDSHRRVRDAASFVWPWYARQQWWRNAPYRRPTSPRLSARVGRVSAGRSHARESRSQRRQTSARARAPGDPPDESEDDHEADRLDREDRGRLSVRAIEVVA